MKKLHVDPGICGFECVIEAVRKDKQTVTLHIQSDCGQIRKLSTRFQELGLRDVLGRPHGQSELITIAAACKLHPSCPIPTACIKAAEAELEMALPRDVRITFEET